MAISTGYQRLDLMNQGFHAWETCQNSDSRIGKNEQVIISEFLTGNRLAFYNHLIFISNSSFYSTNFTPFSVMMQKLSKLVSKQRKLQKNVIKMSHTKHKSKMVSHEILHKYIEMCQHINNPTLSRLMNIIFDKCQEFVHKKSDRSRQVWSSTTQIQHSITKSKETKTGTSSYNS